MALRQLLGDYRKAAHAVAAARKVSPMTIYGELASVRFRFGIGPFYYSLFTINGQSPRDWQEYLVHNKFNPVQRRWNPEHARIWTEDKPKFYQRCRAAALPIPEVLGLIGTNETDSGHRLLNTPQELESAIAAHGKSELFFKLSHGSHGDGAFAVSIDAGRFHFAGTTGTAEMLFRHAKSILPQGQVYIVQQRLRNAAALAPVMSSKGLGTVRAVTTRVNGQSALMAACIRLTVGNNVTDNFSAGIAGNIAAPIDIANGRLGEGVWSVSDQWPDIRGVNVHPGSGSMIGGFLVPQWNHVVELVLKAHEQFPDLGAIGWDVAVTDQGPVLIEANHSWDLNLMQVTHRQGFRSRLVSVMGPLDEVLR